MIAQSKDWATFIQKMTELDYEIKYGKHIAFKHKDKERFTRAKTIGEDYTEERLMVVSISIVTLASTPTKAATNIPPFRIKLPLYFDEDTRSKNRSIIYFLISTWASIPTSFDKFRIKSFSCFDE